MWDYIEIELNCAKIKQEGVGMQKVFESCTMLDERCYEQYGLSEDILMEHAAAGMAQYIRSHFTQGTSVLIVAGKGNNGADGIALARQLFADYEVKLYLPFDLHTDMAKIQLKRALLVGVKAVDTIVHADVVVDALFGAGLTRALDKQTEHIVHQLNALGAYKIACDIPTGIGAKGMPLPIAFHADVTITMGAYKEALFLDACKESVGEIVRVDLGVSALMYEGQSQSYLLEKSDLRLPSRTKQVTHKGSFGHAAIFCGEKRGRASLQVWRVPLLVLGLPHWWYMKK